MPAGADIVTELPPLERRVATIRRFTRFYTRLIGLLRQGMHESPFTLTEARIVYELAKVPDATASDLARGLGLDPGYVSRVLRGLRRRGLLQTRRSPLDARRTLLRLSAAGRKAFIQIDRVSGKEVARLLQPLTADDQERVARSLDAVREILEGESDGDRPVPYLLRPHGPGDLGWVVQAHGALYADLMGWGAPFEALVADIASRFLRDYDPELERCWIAERDGRRVGSVMVVRAETGEEGVAQLRLLLVDPSARGLGIGRRLVQECVRFARQKGYRRLVLHTDPALDAARRIYQAEGFTLTCEEPHHLFGPARVGQLWELAL
jgi:DNA-binding MarR family transcriptional regulator/GNAT superfamily N-acetyltransferase